MRSIVPLCFPTITEKEPKYRIGKMPVPSKHKRSLKKILTIDTFILAK